MVQNGPGVISDKVRTALKVAACELKERELGEIRVSTSVLQGVIKTDWKSYMVGARSGVLFKAHIDHEDGSDYLINFLLNQRDLENGAGIIRQMEEEGGFSWKRILGGQVPVPEFYQFENLAGVSRKLH
jgi:hypothetical protein